MLIHSPKDLALFMINQRKKLKVTQAEIGKLVGLKQQTISEFEQDPARARVETMFKIIFGLNLDMQLSTKDNSNEKKTRWKEEW